MPTDNQRSAQTRSSDSLLRGLPDLVLCVRRDGVILALNGGHDVGSLRPAAGWLGQHVQEIWPRDIADILTRLTRKAISVRATCEARFQYGSCDYEARVSPQGPDRAICVVRAYGPHPSDSSNAAPETLDLQLDRRGFMRRFMDCASLAALRNKPLALVVIHLEGIADIAQAIAPKLSEQVMTTAILRLAADPNDSDASWYLGQLSDNLLALVFESADREVIESRVSWVCASLRQPVPIGGSSFQLTPSAGVSIFGQDASSARNLLDQASAAANEARRVPRGSIRFFTDTLRLRSLARLDLARELHEAISNGDIRLRYMGRHDLATGRLVAWVAYLQWLHPLRGEIRPAEFLRIAEVTGLGTTLSRAAMQWLQDDYLALNVKSESNVRISFGALRHHLCQEDFVAHLEQLLANGVIPPERLELRISERNLGARQPADFKPLADAGVWLIVDEVGRGAASFEWLARAPIRALQLDRAWVVASRGDDAAQKVCRGCIAVAKALDLDSIATGVDDADQRSTLFELGCKQGSGDFYLDRGDWQGENRPVSLDHSR